MNWITLISYIYHWEPRVDNEIIILSYIKIKAYLIKDIERMKGEK